MNKHESWCGGSVVLSDLPQNFRKFLRRRMDRESIDRLERAILLEPNVDRLRELALLAIEGWNKAHQTLEVIQGIVAAAEGK